MFQRTTALLIRTMLNGQKRRKITVETIQTLANTNAQVRKPPSITPATDALYDSFLKVVVRPGEWSGIDGYFINENIDIWRAPININNLTFADFNEQKEVTSRALLAIHLIRRRSYELYVKTPLNDPGKTDLGRNWDAVVVRTAVELERGIFKLVTLMETHPDFPFGQFQNLREALKHYLLPFANLEEGETEKTVEDILFICKKPAIATHIAAVLNWMRVNNLVNESNLNILDNFVGNPEDLTVLSRKIYLKEAGINSTEKQRLFDSTLRDSTSSVAIKKKVDCSTPNIVTTTPRF